MPTAGAPCRSILLLAALLQLAGCCATPGPHSPQLAAPAALGAKATSAERAGIAPTPGTAEQIGPEELAALFAAADEQERIELEGLFLDAAEGEREELEQLFDAANEREELATLFAEAEEDMQRELEELFDEAAAGYLTRSLRQADRGSEQMAYHLEGIARRIDGFFGADRSYEEATDTYLQARGEMTYDRGGTWDFKSKFRLKLDLPQTERRLKLLIESDTEAEDDPFRTGTVPTTPTVSEPGVQTGNYTAALQLEARKIRRWRVALEPGLKLKLPPEAFLRTRLSRKWEQERWLARATEIFGWYTEEGLRSETRLELETLLGEKVFGRLTTKALWSEEYIARRFVLSETVTLVHAIDQRRSLAYDVSVSGETQPNWRDTNYTASIRYRQEIHRGWIFYELRPFMKWDRSEDFYRHPGITFTLELLFGAAYLPHDDSDSP